MRVDERDGQDAQEGEEIGDCERDGECEEACCAGHGYGCGVIQARGRQCGGWVATHKWMMKHRDERDAESGLRNPARSRWGCVSASRGRETFQKGSRGM